LTIPKELANLATVTKQLITGQTFDIASFDRTAVQRLDKYEEQYTFIKHIIKREFCRTPVRTDDYNEFKIFVYLCAVIH
jgi:hypothetical protein